MITQTQIQDIFELAVIAANKAGDTWLANAKPKYEVFNADITGKRIGGPIDTMLDVCGFAYLNVKDKRSAFYKVAKAAGLVSFSGSTYSIQHKYKCRQELGLTEVCLKAALDVFKQYGLSQHMYFTSRID